MRINEWVSEIHRIAADKDEARIIAHAQYLADCAEAHGILRAKGYGQSGTSIVDVARLVPEKG
jgi:hypothetical protein